MELILFGNVDLKKESFGTCEGHLDFDTWNCPKVHYNTELAWLIANHPETYMEASIEDIFGINRTVLSPSNKTYYANTYKTAITLWADMLSMTLINWLM